MWIHLAHLAERLDPALPGHLLVEEHQVIGATTQKFDGIVGVRGGVNLEPALPQEMRCASRSSASSSTQSMLFAGGAMP